MYVNEPGEVLAWCTHQPTNLTWRIKQVLRWHQGAVQLLYTKVTSHTTDYFVFDIIGCSADVAKQHVVACLVSSDWPHHVCNVIGSLCNYTFRTW